MVTRGYSLSRRRCHHCLLQEPKLQNTSGMAEFLSVAAVESAHENEIFSNAQPSSQSLCHQWLHS